VYIGVDEKAILRAPIGKGSTALVKAKSVCLYVTVIDRPDFLLQFKLNISSALERVAYTEIKYLTNATRQGELFYIHQSYLSFYYYHGSLKYLTSIAWYHCG